MRFKLALSWICAFATGCAEAAATSEGGGGDAGGGGTTAQGGGGSGAGGSTANGGSGGGTTGGSGSVVINEIRATGDDFVELYNPGDSAVDLSNFGVTDSLDTGEPKLEEVARFPTGTSLGAGKYLLIVAEQDAALGVGPHEECLPDGGPTSCFYSSWGISGSNGETVFLLSPSDEVVNEVAYPMDAVPDGSTWGKLPDGSGNFAENKPTPGEANEAP